MSPGRICARRRWANSTSNSSPAECPSVSLTSLKLSTSRNASATCFPAGQAGSLPEIKSRKCVRVRQAGQRIVIGEPRDLGSCFLALDRQGPEMDAGVDDALMPATRRTAFPEIEGKGSDHAAILGLDRRGPAGPQTGLERPGFERLPARISVKIRRQHGLAVKCRGPAGADVRTDRNAVQRPGIVLGKAGAAQRMNQSGGVDVENRGNDIGRDLLDTPAKLVGDIRDRNFIGQRVHDQLLQRP